MLTDSEKHSLHLSKMFKNTLKCGVVICKGGMIGLLLYKLRLTSNALGNTAEAPYPYRISSQSRLTTEPRGSQGHFEWKITIAFHSQGYFGVLCTGIKAQLPVKVISVFIASICFIYFNSMVNSELICF